MSAPTLGRHLLLELHEVDAARLSDGALLEAVMRSAAAAAGATVLFGHFHQFGAGQGITGVLLLAESHISIHTWPERAYAAVDIFMCGAARPELAANVIVRGLHCRRMSSQEILRGGMLPPVQKPAESTFFTM